MRARVRTNVIAVLLAAPVLGSAVGGRLADRRPSPAVLQAIRIVGAAWLGMLLVGLLLLRFVGSEIRTQS